MSLGKLAVLAIALSLVSGGVGAALADWNSPEPGPAIELVNVDARIEDDVDGTLVAEPEDDDDAPGGNDALPPLAAPGAQKDDQPARGERPQAALAPVQPVPAGPSASDDVDTGGGAGGAGADDDDAVGGGAGDDDGGDD